MKTSEFLVFRNRLHKTPSQLAQLLGVSEQLVHTYETGEIQISEEHEGRLYFLLSRMLSEDVARQPCWKIKNCSNEKKLNCPAWEFQSGRICWLIDGTVCEGNQNKPWPEKWKTCRECPVIESIAHPAKRHPIQMAEVAFQDNVISQFEQIVGKDPKMQVVYRLIEDVAITNTTVMVQGESGTGKELVARAIHRLSPRKDNPFIVINCSAFPETLLESELFGHEKGAFTGATKTRAGRFEQADKGTIFLDEIGDISPQAQVKLLRVLQTQKFKRLGGDEIISVDIRVITASNKNLKKEVLNNKFRSDLFYRLNVIPVFLPALRSKPNDIPILAAHFLGRFKDETGKNLQGFSPAAMRQLLIYNWPGNIRELEHCIQYAVTLAKGDQIEGHDLPFANEELFAQTTTEIDDSLIANEKRHIIHMLESNSWNKKVTARRLGISRSSLYEKIKRLGIFQNPETLQP